MDRFKNKYRIGTTRLNKNYGDKGLYFITICTQKREHYFGEVNDEKMVLTEIGKIAEVEWLRSFEMRPDLNLIKDVFVVMPNHFHAIIGIDENLYNGHEIVLFKEGFINRKHSMDLEGPGPQYKNISSVIRGFKSAVTSYAIKQKIDFAWQSRFYDHVIREDEYIPIRDYIINNPSRWDKDKFNNPSTK